MAFFRSREHWLAKPLRCLIQEGADVAHPTNIDALVLHALVFKDARLLLLQPANAAHEDTWRVPSHLLDSRSAGDNTMRTSIRDSVINMLKAGIQKGWLPNLQFGDYPYQFSSQELVKDATTGKVTLHLCVNMTLSPPQGRVDYDGSTLHGQYITIDPEKLGEYTGRKWSGDEKSAVQYLKNQVPSDLVQGCWRRNRDATRSKIVEYWRTPENLRSLLRDALAGWLSLHGVEKGNANFVIGCTAPGKGLYIVSVQQKDIGNKRLRAFIDGKETRIIWRGKNGEVDFLSDFGQAPEMANAQRLAELLHDGPGGRVLVEYVEGREHVRLE